MTKGSIVGAAVLAALCLCAGSLPLENARAATPISLDRSLMSTHATGSFDVTVKPLAPEDKADGIALGRFSLDKQYHGDLEATSTGTMLTAGADSTGSAVYVAIERVTGTLQGRRGSFALYHNGTMTREAQNLTVLVAPGSGTGALVGLSGKLGITIVDGKHLYDLEYSLPQAP
jgi:hypothetical protein